MFRYCDAEPTLTIRPASLRRTRGERRLSDSNRAPEIHLEEELERLDVDVLDPAPCSSGRRGVVDQQVEGLVAERRAHLRESALHACTFGDVASNGQGPLAGGREDGVWWLPIVADEASPPLAIESLHERSPDSGRRARDEGRLRGLHGEKAADRLLILPQLCNDHSRHSGHDGFRDLAHEPGIHQSLSELVRCVSVDEIERRRSEQLFPRGLPKGPPLLPRALSFGQAVAKPELQFITMIGGRAHKRTLADLLWSKAPRAFSRNVKPPRGSRAGPAA